MSDVFTATLIQKILAGLLLGCCLVFIHPVVQAATANSATLQWATGLEPDLSGYKVYQGTTAGSYGTSVDVGNTTTYSAQNLQAGLTYYFAITAYDTNGNESPPSLEISFQTPADTLPPSAQVLPPMSDPTTGSTLTSTTVTFTGGHARQPGEQHFLSVGFGTRIWDNLIYHEFLGTGHTAQVSGLPTSGTLHVLYWTFTPSTTWNYRTHTYTMAVRDN